VPWRGQGHSNAEIAKELCISELTVEVTSAGSSPS
jgi:DNA-binding CsgD family transcriptional regulator